MSKQDSASISIMKIIGVSLIFILIFGISVMATETDFRSVEVTMSNGYKMTVLTSKTNVAEILKDNNIIVKNTERVSPDLNGEVTESNKITISNKSEREVQIAKISESGIETTLDEILKNYTPIIEKIVVEQETIPYETITKDVADGATDTKNKVVQEGKDGLKNITYKVKYQNEVEIEKIKVSEEIVKEPVNKIIQVQKNVTNRSASRTEKTATNVASTETKNDTVKTTSKSRIFKVTAYCPCSKCCGKYSNGKTSSGKKAQANHTVAASTQFSFGTKLLINGKVYTVEDRGGAIKGDKIDVYMNTHSQALAWGVKYLPVQVVE